MNKLWALVAVVLVCSGCALGAGTAATAGYSLKAQCSDDLSNKARQEIIEEAKRQMRAEMKGE